MAVRFVAVGELLVDVIAAGAGHGARIRVRPAGSAFNAAVAAVAAGADATVIGTVGDDAPGRMIVRELKAHGIRPLVTVAGATGTFLLTDGETRVDCGACRRRTASISTSASSTSLETTSIAPTASTSPA